MGRMKKIIRTQTQTMADRSNPNRGSNSDEHFELEQELRTHRKEEEGGAIHGMLGYPHGKTYCGLQ